MHREPVRVLQIVGRMDRGGIETLLMNVYRNIDRQKVQFDFLAHYGKEGIYNDEIRAMGGRIYEMPVLKDETRVYYWHFFQYISALNRFFREHREYRIIHGHMTNTASLYMPIARRYGVKHLIAHSHNTKSKGGLFGLVTDILQKFICRYATEWFACSGAAAEWFYPKEAIAAGKVQIIPNAVDAEEFRFDPELRDRMRRELQLEDKTVIGCVGRFHREKNQAFLVKVLREALKLNPDAVLLFVGNGACEEDVRQLAEQENLLPHVRFLGLRTDVFALMQAMDVLAMPSLFEGLPVTGIEAQASGLRIVASDSITKEMNVLDMVEYLPLSAPAGEWAERILHAAGQARRDTCAQMREAGYDIVGTAHRLEKFYLDCAAESEKK